MEVLLLFSLPVMSNSLRPHGLQHTRLSCPSPSPEVCQSSYSLHQWWCPGISSSDTLFSFPSIFPSIRNFSSELSGYIRWPKSWSFSFSISPKSEYSGLISFKIDWFDLLAVQATFRILLQHHSLKASILWHSDFFIVQLSQPRMTTGKTTALAMQTFVSNVSAFQYTV